MKLTNFIVDVGRPVAYYPSLKKITFSTTGSILLCQFLYWSDKTDDGWFYKTTEELEEETGLSYDEQKTARQKLKELNLISEQYKRLDHQLWFKVNQEVLNERWELVGGKTTKPIQKQEVQKTPKTVRVKKEEVIQEVPAVNKTEKPPKKDFVDLIIDQREWPGFKKDQLKLNIQSQIKMRLHMNPEGKKWNEFIDYVADRTINHKESVEKFIEWLITTDNYKPEYWSPQRMMIMWPQAFVKKTLDKKNTFVVKLPEVKEEEYVPMPSRIGKKSIE